MSEGRVLEFDRAVVMDALLDAAESAWKQVATLNETPYGLMMYEGAEYGYVCVSAFTEEGLDRVVEEYRQGQGADMYQGESGRNGLRWSAPDTPYHVLAEVSAPPLLSSDAVAEACNGWDDWEPAYVYFNGVGELCIVALERLDEDGFFGAARDGMTLLLLSRNETESREELVGIARRLNPRPIADLFESQLP